MGIDKLILGKNQIYSLDSYETKVNNNVLVVGTSGAGKTRGIVIPNLLMATGSYIISDPKGNLYKQYKEYLEEEGYVVKKLDFTNPMNSQHYNFFKYIRTTQDYLKVAHMLLCDEKDTNGDPFWNDAAKLLLMSIIAYMKEEVVEKEHNLHNVLKLINSSYNDLNDTEYSSALDSIMENLKRKNPNSYAYNLYKQFRVSASRTIRSIIITINSKLGTLDSPELNAMMREDDIDLVSIGQKKTAMFVVVSDTDRSMDSLANVFFTQAMNELCNFADYSCTDSRLPIPVRFILDDFATNCKIAEFPRMIASIRSRGISTMLMIQSEAQLKAGYGQDDKTIIGNCDTYVYLGGNDIETARMVAERCDMPLNKILNMPIGTNWIFRRGQAPINGQNFELGHLLIELGIEKENIKKDNCR